METRKEKICVNIQRCRTPLTKRTSRWMSFLEGCPERYWSGLENQCPARDVQVRFLFPPPDVMVIVAQLVRALGCGPRGRGFKSRHSPQFSYFC